MLQLTGVLPAAFISQVPLLIAVTPILLYSIRQFVCMHNVRPAGFVMYWKFVNLDEIACLLEKNRWFCVQKKKETTKVDHSWDSCISGVCRMPDDFNWQPCLTHDRWRFFLLIYEWEVYICHNKSTRPSHELAYSFNYCAEVCSGILEIDIDLWVTRQKS